MDLKDFLKIEKLSKKDKVTVVILIIAAVILLLILAGNAKNAARRGMSAGKTAVSTFIKEAGPAQKEQETETRKKESKLSSAEIEEITKEVGRRDPFKPAPKRTGKQSKYVWGLRLEGITMDSEGRPMAIINDEIVPVGGKAGDGEVIRIDKDRVVIKKGEKELELRLWSGQSLDNTKEGD